MLYCVLRLHSFPFVPLPCPLSPNREGSLTNSSSEESVQWVDAITIGHIFLLLCVCSCCMLLGTTLTNYWKINSTEIGRTWTHQTEHHKCFITLPGTYVKTIINIYITKELGWYEYSILCIQYYCNCGWKPFDVLNFCHIIKIGSVSDRWCYHILFCVCYIFLKLF